MNLLIVSFLLISAFSSDCQISNCKTCLIQSSNVCIVCNPGFVQNNSLGCIQMESNKEDYQSNGNSGKAKNQLEKSSSMNNNFTGNIEKENSDQFDFEKFSEECENCKEFGKCNECKSRLSKFKGRYLDTYCGTGAYYSFGNCYYCIPHCYDCTNGHSCYDCDAGYTYSDYECVPSGGSSSSGSSGSSVIIISGTIPSFCVLLLV